MTSDISYNDKFPDTPDGVKWQKRAISTVEIADKYLRQNRLRSQEIFREIVGNDRRAAIYWAVEEALGCRLAVRRVGAPLLCDLFLCDAVSRWLLGCARTEGTIETYISRFADWVAFSEKRSLSDQLDTIARDVQDFLLQLEGEKLAMRTIVLSRNVLRSWFGWLENLGLIQKTPISRDIKKAWRINPEQIEVQNGRRHALSETEAQKIADWAFESASPTVCLAVMLLMVAGLRSGEVAKLERKHLLESEGVWSIGVPGKGNKPRVVVLDPVVVAAWHRYAKSRRIRGAAGPLLLAPGGGHYTPRSIQRWAQQAARVIHRHDEISSHGLRRTAATILAENGAGLDQVRKLLGHSSIEQTARCYVVRPKPMTARTTVRRPEADPYTPATATIEEIT